ncbi:MAG: Ig-like domain-containing protein [Ignavibacteriae bacterium]|nr:Ig-like domain-containing protein [Ignavibacteriota bacterium]
MKFKFLFREKIIFIISIIYWLQFSSCSDREPTAPVEITRPMYLSISPNSGDLAYSKNGIINFIFDEPMDIGSFENKFSLKDKNNNIVSGAFAQNDSIVTFTPKTQLEKSTLYFASLKGSVKDINNNTIGVNGEGIFSDTIEIANTWFFTEGDYSEGGFYNIFLRDRKQGKIYSFKNLYELGNEISSLSAPEGFAISEDGKYAVISNTSKNQVVVYEISTNQNVATFSTNAFPANIVIKNNIAHVISVNGKQLTSIDLNSISILSQNNLSFFPGKLAMSTDGSTLYTFDQVTLDLVLLNPENGQVIKRLNKSIANLVAGEITFDDQDQQLFICDTKGKKVKVVDKDGNSINDFYSMSDGKEPRQIVISKENLILAAGNKVYQLSKSSKEILNNIEFENNVQSLTVIPTKELVYITLTTSVVILDLNTFTILKVIDLGVSGLESIISSPVKN